MLFAFSCGDERIVIDEEEALRLELLLNQSIYKRLWNDLGDTLYEIHTGQKEQFKFTVGVDRIRWMVAHQGK